jgi:hypothetical protein
MTPTVRISRPEELRVERERLLREVGMDELALRRAAADYRLSAEQTAVLDEIDRIDYLLGV